MTDQQHRPGILSQQLFQQLQRLCVQIVRRFVQDDNVGRFGEQTSQQDPVTLAARGEPDQCP